MVNDGLPAGQVPSRERGPRGLACPDNGATKKVAGGEAQRSEDQSLQVQVGDLVYVTERKFVKSLNQHLEDRGSAKGEFFDVYEAAARLKRLQKKGKADKAQRFQEDLESFAARV